MAEALGSQQIRADLLPQFYDGTSGQPRVPNLGCQCYPEGHICHVCKRFKSWYDEGRPFEYECQCWEPTQREENQMSTNDVPGANPANKDVLATGCWAEHEDGSLIFVEACEGGSVVFSIFDTPAKLEYRHSMSEADFKSRFSWKAGDVAKGWIAVKWTWHDKTVFPWNRVLDDFPTGQRRVSANEELSAAQKVAESLNLRAENVAERQAGRPTPQRVATAIMSGIQKTLEELARP